MLPSFTVSFKYISILLFLLYSFLQKYQENNPKVPFKREAEHSASFFIKSFHIYISILQVQYPFLNFLCSALIPELCSDVSAGTSRHIELALVTVSAMRAFPYELSVILDDPDLAVVTAYLTVIALRI